MELAKDRISRIEDKVKELPNQAKIKKKIWMAHSRPLGHHQKTKLNKWWV
jgi:hypothetical protein